ncbi:MAG: Uma2 family endonuclease [Beijerinckiaceae bacterium]
MPILVVEPAEGLPPRRAFTVAEVLRMQEVGIIDPDENFELIEGEIVCMQAKNSLHERIKLALIRALSRSLPDSLQLGVETTLYLSERTFLEPDLTIFPMMETEAVRGPDILLAVEVAISSLAYDRGLKAQLYAKYGVHELWVIDAKGLLTYVHKAPIDGKWSSIEIKGAGEVLTHPTAPGFAVKLSEF